MSKSPLLCVLVIAAILGLTGCDSVSEKTPRQESISAAAIRAAELGVADSAGETECWEPANHAINTGGTAFRILCRVHFLEDAERERYRDVICVGDLARTEPVENCYRWAYYTGTPAFEDAEPWQPGRD